ncbi:hypothetical protein FKR81_06920 [Lentzea tibetensis]|uniref:Uncharacterized protein n=1 Tax=Lentzea tibetensis TaxID=2591470 RepID=A0A563F0F8_9PSEU|nr:hypothetical protein [Lentzea tibetensis]TWP52844.1 hypothetical protein FKR81_06920 [Lentzea tibetensis]
MQPTIYTVQRPGPGTISTMAHPRGFDRLQDEMAGLRALGVDILVCAMEVDERAECGLTDEASAALASGIEFVEIPDCTVPDRGAIASVIADLAGGVPRGSTSRL